LNWKPALMVIRKHGYRRVCARWDSPKNICAELLQRNEDDGDFFCQEQLPVMNPGFIISTHWRKDYQLNGIISRLHPSIKMHGADFCG